MSLWGLIAGSNPTAAMGEVANKTVGGIFDGVKGLIEEFHLAPEQEAKIKLALKEQELEVVKTYTADVQSARQMQMARPSLWPGLISTGVLSGYMWALWYLLHFGIPKLNEAGGEVTIMLFQTLNVAVGMVLQFWLGSSSGSQNKDWLLYKSNPQNGK